MQLLIAAISLKAVFSVACLICFHSQWFPITELRSLPPCLFLPIMRTSPLCVFFVTVNMTTDSQLLVGTRELLVLSSILAWEISHCSGHVNLCAGLFHPGMLLSKVCKLIQGENSLFLPSSSHFSLAVKEAWRRPKPIRMFAFEPVRWFSGQRHLLPSLVT